MTDKQKQLEELDKAAESILEKVFGRKVQFDISIRELSEQEIESTIGQAPPFIGNHTYLFDNSLPF